MLGEFSLTRVVVYTLRRDSSYIRKRRQVNPGKQVMSSQEETGQGDVAAQFEEIVTQYADFVYNVAFRMMGNTHDAEEVAQDAFLSAYRAYGRFRGESQVSTWLYRITMNAALMRLRREKRARGLTWVGVENLEVPSWEDAPERSALASELGDKIQEGISRLPPELRAAVVLRDVSGLSNAEAADALGVTVSSLKSRLHRARVLLRQHLAEYAPGTG